MAPISFFRQPQAQALDITSENALAPVRQTGGLGWLHTLDGLLLHTPLNEGNTVRSYALTHWRGRSDAAWTIGGVREVGRGDRFKLVWPDVFENGVLDMAGSTAAKLALHGIAGPWVVLASALDIKDFQLTLSSGELSQPAWRAEAVLPELVVEQLDRGSLAPLFRSFWLLFGVLRVAVR